MTDLTIVGLAFAAVGTLQVITLRQLREIRRTMATSKGVEELRAAVDNLTTAAAVELNQVSTLLQQKNARTPDVDLTPEVDAINRVAAALSLAFSDPTQPNNPTPGVEPQTVTDAAPVEAEETPEAAPVELPAP